MKYILMIILCCLIYVLSWIIMSPYLLMSFRFRHFQKCLDNAMEELTDCVY